MTLGTLERAEQQCSGCGSPIRWVYHGGHWVALETEPHPQGQWLVDPGGRPVLVPPELLLADLPYDRWRSHATTCGTGPGIRRVSDSISRLMRGDNRRSSVPPADDIDMPVDPARVASACEDCGAAIYWAHSRGADRLIPVDAAPSRRGLLRFVNDTDPDDYEVAPVVPGVGRGERRYTNHHVTCPVSGSASQVRRAMRGWAALRPGERREIPPTRRPDGC